MQIVILCIECSVLLIFVSDSCIVYADLDATGQFERMNMDVDEDEHSIEMHLPYIAKVMEEYVNF